MSLLVDLSSLERPAPGPDLHHLGWPWLRAPFFRGPPLWVFVAYSKSSPPPLRLALALHLLLQMAHYHWGWPRVRAFFYPILLLSFCYLLFLYLFFGRPRPLESKVIRIQSDHPLAFSPPVAAMERSKVICSIQVWGRDGVSLVRPPSTPGRSWLSLLLCPLSLPPTWCCSLQHPPTLRLPRWPWLIADGSIPSWWTSPPGGWTELGFLLQAPFLSSSEERLGRFLKALLSLLPHFSFLHVLLLSPKFLLGGYCMHWGWFSRCLLNGCHWLCLWLPTFWTPFSTVVWQGLATCWRRTSERNLSVGSLHAPVHCFTRFH